MDTVLLYIAGVVIVAVGVLLSILLHETGHFIPAKLFKVHVGQFMVGFGKTIWSRKIGSTEFGIKNLPLGGYISMAGMYPPAKPDGKPRSAATGFFQTLIQDARDQSGKTIVEGAEDRVFYKLPIWKRIIIMLGGPFMNLVIAVGLYALLLCVFGTGAATTTVSNVEKCVLPATSTSKTCPEGYVPTPAATAGIRAGDKLVSLAGVPVSTWNDATAIIQREAGHSIPIVVNRSGENIRLNVTPVASKQVATDVLGHAIKDWGGKDVVHRVGFLGIESSLVTQQLPISDVLPAVGANTVAVTQVVLNLPQRLVGVANAAFGSGPRDPNGPIGLVGVGRIAGQIATIHQASLTDRFAGLLSLLASLNIALFVFNLVPLLPLDGGHIVGALWEGLKRGFARLASRPDPGPVDTAKVVPLTFAVVAVLGAMSLLLLYADIVKPITVQ